MNNKYLCFIKLIGKDIEDLYTYEFLFTENPDVVWGEDFEQFPAGLCNNLTPNEDDYDVVKIVKTTIKLSLIQESSCFGMQDAMDGIVAIGYCLFDDESPLIFNYGDSYHLTEIKLSEKNIVFL